MKGYQCLMRISSSANVTCQGWCRPARETADELKVASSQLRGHSVVTCLCISRGPHQSSRCPDTQRTRPRKRHHSVAHVQTSPSVRFHFVTHALGRGAISPASAKLIMSSRSGRKKSINFSSVAPSISVEVAPTSSLLLTCRDHP